MKLAVSPRLLPRANPRMHGLSQLLLSCLSSSPLLVAGTTLQPSHVPITGLLQFAPICPRNPSICPLSNTGLRFHHSASEGRTSPHFTYHISASYSAKSHRLDPARNLFNYNASTRWKKMIPGGKEVTLSKQNRPASGQDAFFVSKVGDSESVVFGVADGVGGWVESGIDPADFAHSLCDYMAHAAMSFPEGFRTDSLHPRDVLQLGYDKVMQDESIIGGGSTACIAIAEPDGHLEVANLGDSGLIHIGLNAVRRFSEPQIHAFNTPYQLSKIPKQMLMQMRLFGGSSTLADLPKDAQISHFNVKHGDVLIFATDGVWDNLSPQDTLDIVGRYMRDSEAWLETNDGFEVSEKIVNLTTQPRNSNIGENTLQALLALAVTQEAKEASLNRKRDGPFAKEVKRFYPEERYNGGKPDDICVVAVVVVEDTAL